MIPRNDFKVKIGEGYAFEVDRVTGRIHCNDGLTIDGSTDSTLGYDTPLGQTYKINGVPLSFSDVGALAPSGGTTITTVGTISSGTWNGAPIPVAHGGTGSSNASGALTALLPSMSGNDGKVLGTNGSVASWVATGSLLTAGTGVTIASNTVSIGQDVATTADVVFRSVKATSVNGSEAGFSLVNSTYPNYRVEALVGNADVGIDVYAGTYDNNHQTRLTYAELGFHTMGVDGSIRHKFDQAVKVYNNWSNLLASFSSAETLVNESLRIAKTSVDAVSALVVDQGGVGAAGSVADFKYNGSTVLTVGSATASLMGHPMVSFRVLSSEPTMTTAGRMGDFGTFGNYLYIWTSDSTVARHAIETVF